MKRDNELSRQKAAAQATARFIDAVRLNQAATDVFDETMANFLGINRTDGRCLDIIDRVGRVSAGQLANESGLTTGAVTAVVDRLEAAGYVRRERDALDRRKVWIEPTESLRTLTRHIFGFYDNFPPLMARYTSEQLKAIVEFLEIGRRLNLELAAGLKEHLDPDATTTEKRLSQAMRFEKSMQAMAPRIMAELEALEIDDFG